MHCERCIRSLPPLPFKFLGGAGIGFITDHNMERLAEGVGNSCVMCAMIEPNLTTPISTSGLPPQLGDSMLVKIWHEQGVDFFTGDQIDEIRLDAICSGNVAKFELKAFEGPLSQALLEMNDTQAPDEHTGSDNTFRMIRHWLTDCSTHHENCHTSDELRSLEPTLPTRVVDVGPSDGSEEPRLHISNAELAKYVALSHCWGTQPLIQTTSKSISDHLESIPLSTLPKTFQDAVVICRNLGVRYLWIDSLCIIQDSNEDWKREALLMGDVYKNAYLTVVAASAKDSSEGCFLPRQAQKIRPCWSGMLDGVVLDQGSPLFMRPCRDPVSKGFAQLRPVINPGVIAYRGWTLQEQILSRRVLWYHSGMLYCSCLTTEASEQIPEGISGDDFHDMNYWLEIQQAIHGVSDLARPETINALQAAWYRLTMEFSGRKLTYEKDRVYALAGLASEMEKVMAKYAALTGTQAHTFVAGLWGHELWRGLLWVMSDKDFTNTGPKRPEKLQAPTWSWISTTGFIDYLGSGSRIKDLEPLDEMEPMWWDWASLVSITIDSPMPKEIDQFNPLKDGKMKVQGKFRAALPGEKSGLFDVNTGEKCGKWWRDEQGWVEKEVLCMAVASMVPKDGVDGVEYVWCLLLEEVDGMESTYQRVGAARIEAKDWLKGASEITLYII